MREGGGGSVGVGLARKNFSPIDCTRNFFCWSYKYMKIICVKCGVKNYVKDDHRKGKPEKNSGLYGIRTLDLCDTSAALYHNWANKPNGSRSLNWFVECNPLGYKVTYLTLLCFSLWVINLLQNLSSLLYFRLGWPLFDKRLRVNTGDDVSGVIVSRAMKILWRSLL